MVLLSVVELWIHNGLEHGFLGVSACLAGGGALYLAIHPWIPDFQGHTSSLQQVLAGTLSHQGPRRAWGSALTRIARQAEASKVHSRGPDSAQPGDTAYGAHPVALQLPCQPASAAGLMPGQCRQPAELMWAPRQEPPSRPGAACTGPSCLGQARMLSKSLVTCSGTRPRASAPGLLQLATGAVQRPLPARGRPGVIVVSC